MERSSSTIYRQLGIATEDRRIDLLWILFWTIAALVLYTWQLGDLPLRDWDEGIVASVAQQIWRSNFHDWVWFFPQNIDGTPYLNKPPLMHWLIAATYQIGGVHEWTSRLPGALMSAFSVPLLYCVGREMFYRRLPAIFAAGVYLTYLPVVRQGRLAMLDGAILCLMLVMWFCLLRSRRDLRWSLGIGFSIGLMCLTKGALGIVLGAIGLGFLLWDTPRIFCSGYFWSGLVLGAAPVAAWYGGQYAEYKDQFFQVNIQSQTLDRVTTSVESNAGSVWFYLLEILKYGTVWLLFIPLGVRQLWHNRSLSWARMISLWFGSYFVLISLLQTKLPWYAMPLYPAIALLVGVSLTHLWEAHHPSVVSRRRRSQRYLWASGFGSLAIVAIGGLGYFLLVESQLDLVLVCGTFAATLIAAAVTVLQRSGQFIPILIWGMYLTLLGFMSSDNWVWELAEQPPVKPIAELVQKHTPAHQTIYTTYSLNRPSLEFYSDRRIIPTTAQALSEMATPPSGLTVLIPSSDLAPVQAIANKSFKPVAQIQDWAIVRSRPEPRS